MRCRIGYWKAGLGVQVDEEAYEWVRLNGKGLVVHLLHDRRFMLSGGPFAIGTRLSVNGPKAAEWGKHQEMFAQATNVKMHCDFAPGAIELPLFCIHELPLEYDYARDALITGPLAPNHELPWPQEAHRRERLTHDEIMRQCYLRIRSHMLVGGHGYFDEVGVPVEVVRTMSGGYNQMLQKARAELDIARAA